MTQYTVSSVLPRITLNCVVANSIEHLGRYVRARREGLNLTVTQLAANASMSKSEISALENERIGLPGAEKRRRLAAALGVSHLDLLVAACEITRDELGTSIGVVERDPDDPRQRLHAAIDTTPMTDDRIEGLIVMLQSWAESARRRGR